MPHVLHWAPQEEIEEHTQTSHPQYNFESPTRPITFLVDGELHTIAVPILPVWRITVPQTEYRPTPQLRFRHIGPVPPIHFDYIGQQQGSGMLYLDGLNSQDRALVIQNGSDVLFEGIDGKYIYIILEVRQPILRPQRVLTTPAAFRCLQIRRRWHTRTHAKCTCTIARAAGF